MPLIELEVLEANKKEIKLLKGIRKEMAVLQALFSEAAQMKDRKKMNKLSSDMVELGKQSALLRTSIWKRLSTPKPKQAVG